MKATLALEYLGEGYEARQRFMTGIIREAIGPGPARLFGGLPSRRPWVAEINPGGRQFLRPNWQRKRANSAHTRGVELWFILESGRLYEACHHVAWRSKERFFCTVSDAGEIVRLAPEDARQWQRSG